MNICGLYEWKLTDVLGAHLKKYEITLLQETWSAEGDVFYRDDYTYYNFPRKCHKLSMRNSGGLGVFIKHTVADGVTCVKNTEDILVWLKLERSFFSLATDLYLGNVYVVPETSVYLCHDVFNVLRDDISSFQNRPDILVCGDYNARTNTLQDYIDEFHYGNNGDLPVTSHTDMSRSTLLMDMLENGYLNRCSKDKARANRHGNHLIEFCKALSLLIIIGRLGGIKLLETSPRWYNGSQHCLYDLQTGVVLINWGFHHWTQSARIWPSWFVNKNCL